MRTSQSEFPIYVVNNVTLNLLVWFQKNHGDEVYDLIKVKQNDIVTSFSLKVPQTFAIALVSTLLCLYWSWQKAWGGHGPMSCKAEAAGFRVCLWEKRDFKSNMILFALLCLVLCFAHMQAQHYTLNQDFHVFFFLKFDVEFSIFMVPVIWLYSKCIIMGFLSLSCKNPKWK